MCFEKIKDFANSWANVITIGLTIIGIIIAIIGVVIPLEDLNRAENSPPYIIMKTDDYHIKLDENQSIAYGTIYYDIMVTTKPDRYQFIDSTMLLHKTDGKKVTLVGGGGFPATSPFWVLSTGTYTLDSEVLIPDVHRGDNITVTMNYNIEIYDVWLKKTYKGQLDTPITFNISRGTDTRKLSTIKW